MTLYNNFLLKRGVGLFTRVGLISGDYGTLKFFSLASQPTSARESRNYGVYTKDVSEYMCRCSLTHVSTLYVKGGVGREFEKLNQSSTAKNYDS